jgi:hypothetical protein
MIVNSILLYLPFEIVGAPHANLGQDVLVDEHPLSHLDLALADFAQRLRQIEKTETRESSCKKAKGQRSTESYVIGAT